MNSIEIKSTNNIFTFSNKKDLDKIKKLENKTFIVEEASNSFEDEIVFYFNDGSAPLKIKVV